ncbi:c-type cytochrome [Alsobacter sp. SYSU M60028]|uniref:C-type cytochrome n=1 Tax=Alsobacter ponti TaxID=2962936 RepID=A0ABT1L7W4_9HYPH|nr:c-type cytochrome [Alsobacter ponti]MCP8937572.1 c-type cytochrome [Alsobacter ponti]
MTRLAYLFAAAFGLAMALAAPATAQVNIDDKLPLCSACHGENGVPTEKNIPVIWGQHQGYIYFMLRDFKLGQRQNDAMTEIAKDLSRDEMMALAEYFSKKPWPNLNQPRASAEDTKRAESAIVSGQCGACHGEQGMGDSVQPRIAGQQRDYLLLTLTEFRSRKRTNNPWMSDILGTLAPEDMDALANYMAGR